MISGRAHGARIQATDRSSFASAAFFFFQRVRRFSQRLSSLSLLFLLNGCNDIPINVSSVNGTFRSCFIGRAASL